MLFIDHPLLQKEANTSTAQAICTGCFIFWNRRLNQVSEMPVADCMQGRRNVKILGETILYVVGLSVILS